MKKFIFIAIVALSACNEHIDASKWKQEMESRKPKRLSDAEVESFASQLGEKCVANQTFKDSYIISYTEIDNENVSLPEEEAKVVKALFAAKDMVLKGEKLNQTIFNKRSESIIFLQAFDKEGKVGVHKYVFSTAKVVEMIPNPLTKKK